MQNMEQKFQAKSKPKHREKSSVLRRAWRLTVTSVVSLQCTICTIFKRGFRASFATSFNTHVLFCTRVSALRCQQSIMLCDHCPICGQIIHPSSLSTIQPSHTLALVWSHCKRVMYCNLVW